MFQKFSTIIFLSFFIISFQANSQSIVYPKKNAVIADSSINFTWNPKPSATAYYIQISTLSDFSFILLSDTTSITNYTNDTLSFGKKYFFRVRSFDGNNFTPWNKSHFFKFNPSNINGLTVWLDINTGLNLDGNLIESWQSRTNNGISADQSNTVNKPLLDTNINLINYSNTARFDGAGGVSGSNGADFLQLNQFIDFSDFSAFTLLKNNDTDNFMFVFSNSNSQFAAAFQYPTNRNEFALNLPGNSNNVLLQNSNHFTEYSILNLNYDQTQASLYINSSLIDALNYSASGQFDIIGKRLNGNLGMAADLSEVIIYNPAINDSLRSLVEAYLRYKYAPPVNLGKDIFVNYGFCDTTISVEERFVSYNWSNGSSTPSISINKSGEYAVTVTDVFNNTSSDTIRVHYPKILNTTDTTICLGDTLKINSELNDNAYNLNWSNAQSTQQANFTTPTKIYLIATDTSAQACTSASDTFQLEIDSTSAFTSLGNDTSICQGNTIGLKEKPDSIDSYLWSNGDTVPTISISTADNYSLTISSSIGCAGTDTINVSISGVAPNAAFEADSVCLGDITQFTDLSSAISPDILVSWKWEFQSLDTSLTQNTQYEYPSTGLFNATLTVITNNNCSNSTTQQVVVYDNPTTTIRVNKTLPYCEGESLVFSNSSSIPIGDTIVQWNWLFTDDQSNFITETVNKIFPDPGVSEVILTSQTDKGCSSIDTFQIIINPFTTINTITQLNKPDNGEILLTTGNIPFSWLNNPEAEAYNLEVSDAPNFNSLLIDTIIQALNVDIAGLSPFQTYYWRVKSYNYCMDSISSDLRSFELIDPKQISNVAHWYNAGNISYDTISNNVSEWFDLIGNNNAIQNNPIHQSLLIDSVSRINDQPVINFDGSNNNQTDFFQLSNPISMDTFSMFFLIKNTKINSRSTFLGISTQNFASIAFDANNSLFINLSGSGQGSYSSPDTLKREYAIISMLYDSDSLSMYVNGQFFDGLEYNFIPEVMDYIGRRGSGPLGFDGDIAELFYFDEKLAPTEQNYIEQYLRYKYTGVLNLGPDIYIPYGFCDTSIKASEQFEQYLWSTSDITNEATITPNDQGLVSLIVKDIFGYSSADTVLVTYSNRTILGDSTICLGNGLNYNVNIDKSIYDNFIWNDGDTSILRQITDPGFYFYSVDDTNGCSFTSDTLFVSIDSFALKNLLLNDTSLCEGNTIGVLDTSGIVSYNWSSGSNQITTTVQDSGYYIITATNSNGCISTDSINVNIKGAAPNVSFSTDNECVGTGVEFTDQSSSSTGNVNSWAWNFGDQTSSLSQNPTHQYDTIGNYLVTLIVETDSGCVGTGNQTVTIEPRPFANFLYEETCAGQGVPFQELSAPPVGSFITDRKWYFGNGDSANVMNPVVFYDSADVYQVTLISSAANGCFDTLTRSVNIYPAINPAIEAENLCLGNDAQFYDVSPNNSNISWIWDFGGDGSSTQENPRHTFLLSGQYNISLTVTNVLGCVESVSKLITIAEEPQVDFTANSSCPDLPTYFSDLTQVVLGDEITERIWTFDDSNYISRLPNPYHIYSDTGNYNVSLQVKTALGCNSSTSKTISVIPGPEAAFNFTPSFGGAPLEVTFNNQSIGATSYEWSFGDDSEINSNIDPTHIFENEGDYIIKLTAESDAGCSDEALGELYVTDALYDLIILDLETERQIINDCSYDLATTIQFANQGTLPISAIRFSLRLNENATISEIWEGDLQPGAIAEYTFTSKANVLDCDAQYYVCVEATYPDGNSDQTPIDNKNCTSVLPELVASSLYPNPANNILSIDLIAPNSDEITVDLVELKGAKLGNILNEEISAGYSHYDFDVSNLESGVYILNIKYREENISKKFVIIE